MEFPSHNIDPRKKDRKWRLQFMKAAWNCSSDFKSIFYNYAGEYDKIKRYALGRQDTANYRKPMHIDEQSNTTYAALDFKVLPIVKKHRQIALGRLQKSEYNIVCTPIDALARTDEDNYYADTKAKIVLRDELLKVNPELADSPQLRPNPGEPLDLEELEMQMNYGYKHNYAIEAEEGIELIFDQNNITECRHKVFEDLFDNGVAVVKDWMEDDGSVRFRNCDVRSIITNYCRYSNFRDIQYCGEVIDMTWTEFRERANGKFTDEEFERIYDLIKSGGQSVGNNIKTTTYNDKLKVKILDLDWYSVDEQIYVDDVNQFGNRVFTKTDYKFKGRKNTKSVKKQNIYTGKWIIGTDFIYDDGPEMYQKRSRGLFNAKLSFHITATNFYDMRASGVMEDIIPIADQMAIAWLKLQSIRNNLQAFAWDIDLGALEEVDFAKSGKAMTPKELIQMFFQNGILINRRKSLTESGGSNYRTIEFIQTNYGQLISDSWNDFNNFLALLKEATGFNEATDGSTINPKNLNSTNALMNENTNNALYHLQRGEEIILLSLAESVLCRMKRAIKMGKVEGYIRTLGYNTVKFISVSPEVGLHDFGIKLESKPTTEQRQRLQELLIKYTGEGLLEPIDNITIENCRNLKQAEQILSFRVQKRKEAVQQRALQMQQQNGQIQIQSSQASEQAKQQTLQIEYQLKMQLMDKQKQWDYDIEKLRQAAKMATNSETISSNEKIHAKEMGEDVSEPTEDVPLPQAD